MMFRMAVAWGGFGSAWGRLRRAPHWVWPLAVGAVFLTVGVLVLDDYAIWSDSTTFQIPLVTRTVDFALGNDDALSRNHNKFYGAAFEVLPLLVERAAGLEDSRRIHLTRHLMTHLFFIAGGVFCYLLAYRMFGSRLLALLAMLAFLLHPRLYGHSFFNTKDIPFLSMFMIALFCVHWAFHRGTVAAFVVCGIAVGILMNLRIMGAMLLLAALAMRGCDLCYAAGWSERRRVIVSGAAFALAAALIYYASLPYLWADPIGRFGELLATLSEHPWHPYERFQGRDISGDQLPTQYLPVWVAITTPPALLLLSGMGIAVVAGRAIGDVAARAGAALRNTQLRFGLLLVGCVVLPAAAVLALDPVMYNNWRQNYFLWAPLCLLAVVGLERAGGGLAALAGRCGWRRYPSLVRRWSVVGLAGAVVVVLAISVVQMIGLHPYQHMYFNRLVDRGTPEYLKTQYEMDYYYGVGFEALKYMLDHHRDEDIFVAWHGDSHQQLLLPAAQRRRFAAAPQPDVDADYYVLHIADDIMYPPGLPDVMRPPVVYSREVYNNTIVSVLTPDVSRFDPAVADTYRAIYRAAVRGKPTRRGDYDIYWNENETGKTVTVVKEDCQPGELSRGRGMRIYPAAASDLLDIDRAVGHIDFRLFGVRLDGKCLMQATLPDYDIARIVVAGVGNVVSDDYRLELRREYAGLQELEPAIRDDFAVYAGDGELIYLKDECRPEDRAARFYLHIIPVAADILSDDRREHGYDNLDFNFALEDVKLRGDNLIDGIVFDDKCLVTVPLPNYEIQGIRTGQYLAGGKRLWGGEFDMAAYRAVWGPELAARTDGEPAAAGFFSVYYNGGELTYVRAGCNAADLAAVFYLHLVPVRVNDLPAEVRGNGFENRDFEFGSAGGVRYDEHCLVSVALPEYAIDRIYTGQYMPDAGRLWETEFTVAEQLSAP